MAFKTYGANDFPDLVSASSILGGKIDGTMNAGSVELAPNIDADFATGDEVLDIGMNTAVGGRKFPRRIVNVRNPTADTDAATKGYVDSAASSGNIITDVCENIYPLQILVNGSIVKPASLDFQYANNLKALIIDNKPIIIYSIPDDGSYHQTSLTISYEFAKGDMVHVEAHLSNVNQDFIDCVTLGNYYPLRPNSQTKNIISSASIHAVTLVNPFLDTDIIVGAPTNSISIIYC